MRAIDFAKARDAFLLMSGIAYVAGYVVWAVVAWLQNLGPLPVIEGQYFAAGLPIILLIAGSVLGMYFSMSGGQAVGELALYKSPERRKLFVARILTLGFSLISLAMLLFTIYFVRTAEDPINLAKVLLSFLFSLMMWAVAYGVMGSIRSSPGVTSVIPAIIFCAAALLISILLVSLFIREVYPRIPQALGGAKPQCGQLDLRSADFSQETLAALGANPSQEVARTKELEIFFQSTSTVIVEVPTQDGQQSERFELDRGGVAAIRMC